MIRLFCKDEKTIFHQRGDDMIVQNLNALQVEKTSNSLTSFAGLPLILGLAERLKLPKKLNGISGLKMRQKGYSIADHVLSLAITLIAGGRDLEDVERLKHDAGLTALLEDSLFPCANTLGEFLRRFDQSSLWHLGKINAGLIRTLIARRKLSGLTLDLDATIIESYKMEARKTFKGCFGYDPLLMWIPELNVFLTGLLRDGNVPPQSHNASLLRKALRFLPKGLKLRFRSDSAGYQSAESADQLCHKHNIEFAIRADMDISVQKSITSIKKKDWKLITRGTEVYLIAETVHAPFRDENLPAYRLIVTRKIKSQLELFESPLKDQAILSSLPEEEFSTEEVFNFYNKRGADEKAIGELKNGFGVSKVPCKELLASSAHFQIALLSYTLTQAFKIFCLPESWFHLTIQTLRYRLIGQAALIVCHARRFFLKLSDSYFDFSVFQEARRSLFAPIPSG